MTPEEMATEAQYRVGAIVDALVEKKMKSLAEPKSDELTGLVWNSEALKQAILEYFEQHAATTVGNRLRCGRYDATQMEKIFDSIWTEQFERSVADNIRGKVYKAIIEKRLNDLKDRK